MGSNYLGRVGFDVWFSEKFIKKEFSNKVLLLTLWGKKRVDKVKHYVFKDVKKFKIQRQCKACGCKIVVENANRYYCDGCRG